MPFFTRELNELADYVGRAAGTLWLHTAAPTNAVPTNGRTSAGGGAYENGLAVTATEISDAVNGMVAISADKTFGVATAAVGTVTHWSFVRGVDAVAWGTLPNVNGSPVTIDSGDEYQISANTLRFRILTS